jgi:hypothetical protein
LTAFAAGFIALSRVMTRGSGTDHSDGFSRSNEIENDY